MIDKIIEKIDKIVESIYTPEQPGIDRKVQEFLDVFILSYIHCFVKRKFQLF